ncbi:3376_t:CDS:2 [Entrophospora sp. SA101]|nr:3376_t:CDS:2 [Entrophospora sp. SA101]
MNECMHVKVKRKELKASISYRGKIKIGNIIIRVIPFISVIYTFIYIFSFISTVKDDPVSYKSIDIGKLMDDLIRL